jgi:hypothetical protein
LLCADPINGERKRTETNAFKPTAELLSIIDLANCIQTFKN